MKCPFCGFAESKVIDSRPNDETIRRKEERVPILPEEVYHLRVR